MHCTGAPPVTCMGLVLPANRLLCASLCASSSGLRLSPATVPSIAVGCSDCLVSCELQVLAVALPQLKVLRATHAGVYCSWSCLQPVCIQIGHVSPPCMQLLPYVTGLTGCRRLRQVLTIDFSGLVGRTQSGAQGAVLNLCGTCYDELQVLGWILWAGRDAEEFGYLV